MGRKVIAFWLCLAMILGMIVIVDVTMDFTLNVKGATLYVNMTGSGGAYTSIQEAIDATHPGDTVFVYEGTYYENLIIHQSVNLIGENASSTIIDGDATGDVVHLDADYVNITGFTIHNSGNTHFPDYDSGIKFDNVQHCKIENNIFSDNRYGIYLMSSSNNSIDNNDFSFNIGNGIYLVSSSYNNIFNNEVTFGGYLINLDESSYNNLTNNNISNSDRGLVIWDSTYNTVLNNEILNNNWGIYNVYAPRNRIINNNISNNSDGIQLGTYSNHTEIAENNILSNNNALEVSYSSDIIIDGNNISDSYYGCNFRMTSNVRFTNNSVMSTNIYGFLLDSSDNFSISNNYFFNDSIFIQGDSLEHFNSHDISPDNSVNGKSLIFHKDRSGLTIEGENIGQVILVNCTSMKVRNVAINKIDIGMEVAFSDNITVKNSRFTHNLHGLYLYSLSNSSIGNNNISFHGEIGIIMELSSYNKISDNQMISNDDGIHVESSLNNSIIRNRIVDCDYGIRMWYSQFNNITNNIFLYNYWTVIIQSSQNNIIMQNNVSFGEWLGIYIKSSSNNHIYHNNIIDNENQAYDDRSDNFWDNGYPSGGNFWSDYSGSDDFSGPNQDIPGSDGIGDTDYYIDGNSIDYNPLMTPIEDVTFQKPVYNIDKGTYYDQIQIAHDDADMDNTIVVSKGVFKENITINKTITLLGENKDETIIEGNGNHSVVNILADWVNISGFSIIGSGNLTEDAGLKLTDANYCTISEVCIKENNKHGIFLKNSSYNNITFNYLESNNGSGLKLIDSSENNISYNYITYNTEYGIHLSGSNPPSLLSENNTIFHNNIQNNSNQSFDDTNFKNNWDIGYPLGGNYWSDYIGEDEFSGPNQNLPGPDEIGDTNYSIDSDSYDRYPLIRRFENILKPVCNVDKDTYYDKIQDALDDSDSGNTILVKNGTYQENLEIEKTVNLIGEDRNGTIIDGLSQYYTILVRADWVNISGFTVTNAENYVGILLISSNNTIDSNNITDSDDGIYVGRSNNIITNNTFYRNFNQHVGIGNASNNIIMFNQFYGYRRLNLEHYANSNAIISNHFINCSIELDYSSNNTILDNHFTGISSGLSVYWSTNNSIMDNSFEYRGIYIDGHELSHFNSHEITADNIVNGNPIYYFKDSFDLILNDFPIGQLILANCTNTQVKNLRFSNASYGIVIAYSSDSFISNNNISAIGNGIFLIGSSKINIENNKITNSAGGIRIRSSTHNTIHFNIISNNKNTGIGFDSPPEDGNRNNTISFNNISYNFWGISLFRSKDNLVVNNNLHYNQYAGISITGSSPNRIEDNNISHGGNGVRFTQSSNAILTGNTIFNNSIEFYFFQSSFNIIHHNNIIDNDVQLERDWSPDNEWDDGNGEGNYWSDYTGVDTDGDGVGDTQIPHHGDRYPLIAPNPTVPSIPLNLQTDFGDGFVILKWEKPTSDSGFPITGYNIYRDNASVVYGSVAGDKLWFIDDKIVPGNTYTYYVSMITSVGEGLLSTGISAKAGATPSVPTDIVATAGDSYVNLTWTTPDSEGGYPVRNYIIYRGETQGEEIYLTDIENILFFNDTSVQNGITYYYKVSAKNHIGEGDSSVTVGATPMVLDALKNNPPTCSFLTLSSGSIIKGNIELIGTAKDTDGVVQKVEIRIDNGNWIVVEGTTLWAHTLDTTSLSNDEHTIYARAFDGLNYSSETRISVLIENPSRDSVEKSIFEEAWFWAFIIFVIVLLLLVFIFLIRKSPEEKMDKEEPLHSDEKEIKVDDLPPPPQDGETIPPT